MVIKRIEDEPPGINLTPMIDIVFLLIIFFMVGTRFSELNEVERNMQLQVPQVTDAGAMTPAPSKRIINVFANGRIVMDEQEYNLDELRATLQQSKAEYNRLGVIVRGEHSAQYQRVADVLAACREVDIRDLGVSVRVARKD
ncbi:MAG TPA: biopolymer transporter ExbD [Pirellulaceae bacterium]|nr:biopolymer transporter ExbD [Pirellulaceae bacterium]HMO92989.1 biopolymer transporter ExbD [Pirellulaceae bacterium]HMP67933.1 biopolymer transporter ExbD [Pirellulaceae bacterium]